MAAPIPDQEEPAKGFCRTDAGRAPTAAGVETAGKPEPPNLFAASGTPGVLATAAAWVCIWIEASIWALKSSTCFMRKP